MADVAPWMVDILPERYFVRPKSAERKPEEDVPGRTETRDQVTSTLSNSDQGFEGKKEQVAE